MANITNASTKGISYVSTLLAGMTTKLVLAVVILLIGFIIGIILGRLAKKLLNQVKLNEMVEAATAMKWDVEGIFSKLLTYLLYVLFIVLALRTLGLELVVFNVAIGGIIILVFIALALAINDFIPNIIAGMQFKKEKRFDVGDEIQMKDLVGKVVSITLVETKIQTEHGDIMSISHSSLKKSGITVKKQKQTNAKA
ncbi:mechanosensitive ion channel [Candidatus Woesearchaeota archaeon]|nr:mechanosensitive ion channel [Candidatus Woesearchaeota archaeon]